MSSPSRPTVPTKHDRQHTHHLAAKPGTPKKEGAGGKGTWGKEGSEYGSDAQFDERDPNYDSEDDAVPPTTPAIVVFKAGVSNILDEYFVSGDADEVRKALKELGHPDLLHEFVKIVLSRAFDLHDRERELASELLPQLYPDVISFQKIAEGFTALLERIEDLKLDIPNAPELLSMFLARAVVDDLLPPAFLSPDNADVELAKETLIKARMLIEGKMAAKRVANIWGPAGNQSVKKFKERAVSILEEFVVTNDIVEADRAIRELDAPSFNYYVVKKAVLLALDVKDNQQDMLIKLLTSFYQGGLISEDHFVAGFKSCVDSISDIELDTPNARERLSQFIKRSQQAGYLPASFLPDSEQVLNGKK